MTPIVVTGQILQADTTGIDRWGEGVAGREVERIIDYLVNDVQLIVSKASLHIPTQTQQVRQTDRLIVGNRVPVFSTSV
jgi:hypothetical protein